MSARLIIIITIIQGKLNRPWLVLSANTRFRITQVKSTRHPTKELERPRLELIHRSVVALHTIRDNLQSILQDLLLCFTCRIQLDHFSWSRHTLHGS